MTLKSHRVFFALTGVRNIPPGGLRKTLPDGILGEIVLHTGRKKTL